MNLSSALVRTTIHRDNRAANCVLQFLEAEPLRIMYPIGRTIAFYDVSNNVDNDQRLTCIKIDDQLDRITALCLSHQCLALACKFLNDKSAYIFFYDLTQGFRKINKLVHEGSPTDLEERYFISISFSLDSTHIGTLTNLKMSTAKVYELKKDAKIMSACSWLDELKKISKNDELAEIDKITVDPNDSDQVCMSGKNHLRLWRNNGGILKPNPPIINIDTKVNFVDHVWIDSTCIVTVTDKADIYLIGDGKECLLKSSAFGELEGIANR